MRATNILFLFLLLILSSFSHAQNKAWPDIDEISLHFFKNYEPQAPAERYFEFSREPDGYYVALLHNARKIKAKARIYSFEDNAFLPIDICPKKEGADILEDTTYFLQHKEFWQYNSYYQQGFELYPYYGYDGWYHDAIDYLEKQPQLSNDQLNALARSYQTKLSGLFYNASGYADSSTTFELPSGRGHLSEEQLALVMDIHKKRMDAYRLLKERDPSFMTPVGPIGTKYANESMELFLLLAYHQDEALAKSVIEEGSYNEGGLMNARNMLRSCPKDAVLYTWGDTDTYSAYYVQAIEGFRTDVIVANTALLSVPRYLRYIYDGPLGAKPLLSNFPDPFFELTNVMIHSTAAYEIPNMENWYRKLETEASSPSNLGDNVIYFTAPAAIKLPVPTDAPAYEGALEDTILLHVYRHMLNEDSTPIDILYSNNWQRPICFALTCRAQLWGLWPEQHLVQEGMVYRIYPSKLPEQYDVNDYNLNLDKTYDLWMNSFEWDNTTKITDSDKGPYYTIYLLTGVRLMNQLMAAEDPDKALQVLHSMPNKLPNSLRPWGVSWINIFRAARNLEAHDIAAEVAIVILQNYKADLLSDFDETHKERIVQEFKDYADKHPSAKLLEILADF